MGDLVFSRIPVPEGTSISGTFGQTEGYPHPHRGVDYACAEGTPIVAPADGTVVSFLNDGSFGNGVCLDHENTPFFSLFAHLSEVKVEIGQKVRAGELLGLSGRTGLVTGPHLHWQVCRSASFPADITVSADPLQFLRLAQPPEPGPLATAIVTGTEGCLHVRESPSLSAVSSGCFPDGTALRVRGEAVEAEGRSWLPVLTPSGEAGFSAAEFLVVQPS